MFCNLWFGDCSIQRHELHAIVVISSPFFSLSFSFYIYIFFLWATFVALQPHSRFRRPWFNMEIPEHAIKMIFYYCRNFTLIFDALCKTSNNTGHSWNYPSNEFLFFFFLSLSFSLSLVKSRRRIFIRISIRPFGYQ